MAATLLLSSSSILTAQAQTANDQEVISTAGQKQVPADHYDPDDTKRYVDVVAEDQTAIIAGQQFTIHYYRPQVGRTTMLAIYVCGDGGWRGLAPRTAEELAHRGFAVAGVDSKVYLREFSSVDDPLTIRRLATGFAELGKALRLYAGADAETKIYVYGWSLGAGFAIAVGSDLETRRNWAGIISIGLPRQNQLVSGVGGNYVDLNSSSTSAYGFLSADLIAAVSPLPLVMIQSTSDTASPPRVGRALFGAARDPKQLIILKAHNHRFSGAREEFYSALVGVVPWMRDPSRAQYSTEAASKKP